MCLSSDYFHSVVRHRLDGEKKEAGDGSGHRSLAFRISRGEIY